MTTHCVTVQPINAYYTHKQGRYNFGTLQVGSQMLIPWTNGHSFKERNNISSAMAHHQDKYNQILYSRATPDGVLVWRVK